jgi:hypothetical protein
LTLFLQKNATPKDIVWMDAEKGKEKKSERKVRPNRVIPIGHRCVPAPERAL